jgi:acyl-CoA synthetase (AMP-forming)/AMP-acid ligase II
VTETIPALLLESARRYGDRVEALVDGELRFGFVRLRSEVNRAARALIALGVERGDRVAIWAPNIWEWPIAAFAVHSVGAVLVPINTRFKGHEAAELLGRSRAKVLLTVNGFLGVDYVGLLRSSGIALPELLHIGVLRGEPPPGTRALVEIMEGAHGVSEAAVEERALAVEPEHLADIVFTSGTTGRAKGVMCTHRQDVIGFRAWCDSVGLAEGDRYLVVAPFFHSFGYKAGLIAALHAGATVYPQAVFDAGAVLRRITRDRITVLPGPPALYQSMLAHPELAAFDLSSLRLAVTGAAAIPVELIERMRCELGFERVVTGYGLTETTGIATMCRHDDDPQVIATRAGRPIPGVSLRIADDGEVLIRGYVVSQGYFDDPEETARAIDADGWLHTGDVGRLDERGYLQITDRKKDIFNVGGFKASPAEIERTILTHPAIAEAAVIGVPDARLGEVGMAFVVLRSGAALEEAELIGFCRERMANYKVQRRIEVLSALPRNASGKVLKHALQSAR